MVGDQLWCPSGREEVAVVGLAVVEHAGGDAGAADGLAAGAGGFVAHRAWSRMYPRSLGERWPQYGEGDARGTWEPFQFSGEELKAGMAGLQLLCRGAQFDAAAELLALMDNKSAATSKERISLQGFTAPTSRGLYFWGSEDNVRMGLRQRCVSVCSDPEASSTEPPFADAPTHPRAHGAFARVLGRYVRDGLLTLEQAVRRMTSQPAVTLRLVDRGRIRAGAWAALVVFDPAPVQDHATYAGPRRYAAGLRHVLINGRPALHDGEPAGELAGRSLRRGVRLCVPGCPQYSSAFYGEEHHDNQQDHPAS